MLLVDGLEVILLIAEQAVPRGAYYRLSLSLENRPIYAVFSRCDFNTVVLWDNLPQVVTVSNH